VLAVASLVTSIVISAPWSNNGTIPKRYTCDGAGTRPPITWAGRTRHPFALELVDPDAPGGTFVHWLETGSVQGRNSAGGTGWTPPCPPPGATPHHYVLHVYVLKRPLHLKTGFTGAQLHRALRGDVRASGTLVGRYGRR
jgi:phosphatidylethanolamine-binding protein (PEBP) family uncharacterized protein